MKQKIQGQYLGKEGKMKKQLRKAAVLTAAAILAGGMAAPATTAFAAQWKSDAKGWWVENDDGSYLVNQWYLSPSSGLWYYMGDDGYMLTNKVTPDGCYVDANGVWDPAAGQSTQQTAKAVELPEDVEYFGGSAYKIYKISADWNEAKLYCENMGGHLAAVTSEEEQEFIEQLNESSARLWIGGYRDDDYNWFWVTGEPWDYTNWAAGEPNNSRNVVSNENRAAVWPKKWNDLNENNKYEQSGFICEWDLEN